MRLREYSEALPKPMVEIGYRPILWHLMKYYAHFDGVKMLKFVPVMGAFASLEPAYKEFGDALRPSKDTYKFFPGVKVIVSNFADQVLLIINDP